MSSTTTGDDCLRGCIAKLNWGKQHIEMLDADIGRYLKGRPYRIDLEPDFHGFDKAGDFLVHTEREKRAFYRRIVRSGYRMYLRVQTEPDHFGWAVRVGAVIHALRSTLDHIAWDLSCRHSGPPPPDPLPRGDPWRRVAFPIVTDHADWPVAAKVTLAKVNPKLIGRFERLQPSYKRKRPLRQPLAVLNNLWVFDKHRTLRFLAALTEINELLPQNLEEDPLPFGVSLVKRRLRRPLENGTEIGRVKFNGPFIASINYQEAHVNKYLRLSTYVAFDDGYPAHGGEVIRTLTRLHASVANVLETFQPQLR